MSDPFNELVLSTVNKIVYGIDKKEIAATLVLETGSQEQAFLIYMAAKSYLVLWLLDETVQID